MRFIKVKDFLFKILTALYGLFLCILTSACGSNQGQRESFSFLYQNEVFFQVVQKEAIDIVWVIDNSGSMRTHQAKLRENFQAFFKEFEGYGYDFRIGIVTTDVYRDKEGGGGFHSGDSGKAILTQNMPRLEELFMENVLVGINGSAIERGMDSLVRVLKSPEGLSFLRPDSHLNIIVVSDEQDSSLKQYPLSRGNGYSFETGEEEAYVSHFIDELTTIKGNKKDFSISAITTDTLECQRQLRSAKSASSAISLGTLYRDLALATLGSVNSLCAHDFSKVMGESARSIVSLSRYLQLTRDPDIATLQVFINGEEKIKNKDWFYNSEENTVFFHVNSIPQHSDSIKIHYLPLSIEL